MCCSFWARQKLIWSHSFPLVPVRWGGTSRSSAALHSLPHHTGQRTTRLDTRRPTVTRLLPALRILRPLFEVKAMGGIPHASCLVRDGTKLALILHIYKKKDPTML